jgi:hypothetical protein
MRDLALRVQRISEFDIDVPSVATSIVRQRMVGGVLAAKDA